MLRVTVELIPNGDEDRAKTLGVLEIANVEYTGYGEMHRYTHRITKADDRDSSQSDEDTWSMHCVLHEYKDTFWKLISLVLSHRGY